MWGGVVVAARLDVGHRLFGFCAVCGLALVVCGLALVVCGLALGRLWISQARLWRAVCGLALSPFEGRIWRKCGVLLIAC